jgi:hypothetical protein
MLTIISTLRCSSGISSICKSGNGVTSTFLRSLATAASAAETKDEISRRAAFRAIVPPQGILEHIEKMKIGIRKKQKKAGVMERRKGMAAEKNQRERGGKDVSATGGDGLRKNALACYLLVHFSAALLTFQQNFHFLSCTHSFFFRSLSLLSFSLSFSFFLALSRSRSLSLFSLFLSRNRISIAHDQPGGKHTPMFLRRRKA